MDRASVFGTGDGSSILSRGTRNETGGAAEFRQLADKGSSLVPCLSPFHYNGAANSNPALAEKTDLSCQSGSVAERLKAAVLKTAVPETVPKVRILPLPL